MTFPPRSIVLAVAGRLEAEDAPQLSELVGTSLATGDASETICDVGELVEVDAGTVDELARLRLIARRLGCDLRLRGASSELLELLAFVGLDEVFPGCELSVEPGREAEEREQRVGVEEEGELGDPAA